MKRKNTFRNWLIGAIALEMVILISLTGAVYAKYIAQEQRSGSITINAELGDIALYEHEAVKNASGQYELNTSTTVSGNLYDTVIPGTDIPKDPYVQITNKSDIPAYVFVEIVANFESSDDDISFSTTSDWTKLTQKGPHNGDVYVYKDVIDKSSAGTIPVLYADAEGNSIFVSQELKSVVFPDGGLSVKLYAYMGQAANMTAEAVFDYIKSGS